MSNALVLENHHAVKYQILYAAQFTSKESSAHLSDRLQAFCRGQKMSEVLHEYVFHKQFLFLYRHNFYVFRVCSDDVAC